MAADRDPLEPKRPPSLLQEREDALCDILRRKFSTRALDEAQTQTVRDADNETILASIRVCHSCGEQIYARNDEKRLLLEFDNPEKICELLFAKIEQHLDEDCLFRRPPQKKMKNLGRTLKLTVMGILFAAIVVFWAGVVVGGAFFWIDKAGIVPFFSASIVAAFFTFEEIRSLSTARRNERKQSRK